MHVKVEQINAYTVLIFYDANTHSQTKKRNWVGEVLTVRSQVSTGEMDGLYRLVPKMFKDVLYVFHYTNVFFY